RSVGRRNPPAPRRASPRWRRAHRRRQWSSAWHSWQFPLCRLVLRQYRLPGLIKQRLDVLQQLGGNLDAVDGGALAGFVAALRRQARALARDALEHHLGAGEMLGRQTAEEA